MMLWLGVHQAGAVNRKVGGPQRRFGDGPACGTNSPGASDSGGRTPDEEVISLPCHAMPIGHSPPDVGSLAKCNTRGFTGNRRESLQAVGLCVGVVWQPARRPIRREMPCAIGRKLPLANEGERQGNKCDWTFVARYGNGPPDSDVGGITCDDGVSH